MEQKSQHIVILSSSPLRDKKISLGIAGAYDKFVV